MAPFNLSDFAHKEIKIPGSNLIPPKQKSYVGRFLLAHFFDFWSLCWISAITVGMYQGTFLTYMQSSGIKNAWNSINFTPVSWFTCLCLSFVYFFCSYYLNHGQTPGMKFTKCRMQMREHHFKDAFNGVLRSFAIFGTLGVATKRFSYHIVANDHLWHELMQHKDVVTPDIRSLNTGIVKEDFNQAA